MIRTRPIDSVNRAMTLAEVLITVVIVSMVGLAIMASIQAGIRFQQSIREENGATRAAADILDATRKEFFSRLEYRDIDNVLIDSRGTEGEDDDIRGEAELRFFAPFTDGTYFDDDGNRNEVGIDASGNPAPLPGELTMVIAEVAVRWNRAVPTDTGPGFGEDGDFDREVVLSTLLAP